MSDYVLSIDDKGKLAGLLREALVGVPLKVVGVEDFASAKRHLIQAVPRLVLLPLNWTHDSEAGFVFAKEVSQHPQFSSVPIVILAPDTSSAAMEKASAHGAQALLPWPLNGEQLAKRLTAFIPELESVVRLKAEKAVAPASQNFAQTSTGTSQPAELGKTTAAEDDLPKKLESAQHILAKVLHGLKTSDLLRVVEIEDVPRVVYEMTKSVCGITEDSPQKTAKTAGITKSSDVEMDLAGAFGLKK